MVSFLWLIVAVSCADLDCDPKNPPSKRPGSYDNPIACSDCSSTLSKYSSQLRLLSSTHPKTCGARDRGHMITRSLAPDEDSLVPVLNSWSWIQAPFSFYSCRGILSLFRHISVTVWYFYAGYFMIMIQNAVCKASVWITPQVPLANFKTWRIPFPVPNSSVGRTIASKSRHFLLSQGLDQWEALFSGSYHRTSASPSVWIFDLFFSHFMTGEEKRKREKKRFFFL